MEIYRLIGRSVALAAEFIFAIPLSIAMSIGTIYIFSWFMLGPVLLPFAFAVDNGSFIAPFIVINGSGVVGIAALHLTEEYLDIDRVLFTGLAQMIVVAVVAGAYFIG